MPPSGELYALYTGECLGSRTVMIVIGLLARQERRVSDNDAIVTSPYSTYSVLSGHVLVFLTRRLRALAFIYLEHFDSHRSGVPILRR